MHGLCADGKNCTQRQDERLADRKAACKERELVYGVGEGCSKSVPLAGRPPAWHVAQGATAKEERKR
jgi:hypothetical protein